MSLNFNFRKFFHFGENRKSIRLAVAGFNSSPAISLTVDGGEQDFTFHLGLGLGLYITFTDFLPKSWYPQDKSTTYGLLPGERNLSIKFHHWSLWWCFWKDDTSWSRTDSKIRSGSFDFNRLLKGKHTCEFTELEKENHIVSMLEGNYQVEVIKNLRVDSWQRWFTRKSESYEVKAGYYDSDNKWVECAIPVEGKGENSWDCDENARYSSHFPAKRPGQNIKHCIDAARYFEQSVKEDRVRYGGKNWLPKKYKTEGLKTITA